MQDAETLLNDITFMALDHGISSIEDDAAPLIPFAVTESREGERTLKRFVTEQIEDGVEAAKNHIDDLRGSIVRYAIAWDGYVTIGGQKWDAILVESGDECQEAGYLMLQRYERKGMLGKKNVPVGNPTLAERPPSRLKIGEQDVTPNA